MNRHRAKRTYLAAYSKVVVPLSLKWPSSAALQWWRGRNAIINAHRAGSHEWQDHLAGSGSCPWNFRTVRSSGASATKAVSSDMRSGPVMSMQQGGSCGEVVPAAPDYLVVAASAGAIDRKVLGKQHSATTLTGIQRKRAGPISCALGG